MPTAIAVRSVGQCMQQTNASSFRTGGYVFEFCPEVLDALLKKGLLIYFCCIRFVESDLKILSAFLKICRLINIG